MDSSKKTESKDAQTVPLSPWEEYLTGKRIRVAIFLKKIELGVTPLDQTTKNSLAEALVAKPERIGRLIQLLQASTTTSITIRRIIEEVAETTVKHLNILPPMEQFDATSFSQAASAWAARIAQKPIKPDDLMKLFLLLHFGWQRQLLDQDTGFALVASAVRKPLKATSGQASVKEFTSTPLEILLTVEPTIPVISRLIAYFDASKVSLEKQNTQITSQSDQIKHLTAEISGLDSRVAGLETEIATVLSQQATAEATITELEKQALDIRAGYQHQIYEMRERTRGILANKLRYWLQTALDASQIDPPSMNAIEERLEDALQLIEKEIQWLQPSA